MSGSKSRYIPALDGLRAFAVLAVIAYHMRMPWAPGGLLGVTVFFVLSGYLITSLLLIEYDDTGKIDLPHFWLRRIRRLVPAIVLVIVCTAVLCTLFNHALLTKMRPDVLPSLLFFNNWWQIFHDVSYFEALGAPSVLLMTGYGASEYGRGVRGTLNCANIREAASVIARGEREGAGSAFCCNLEEHAAAVGAMRALADDIGESAAMIISALRGGGRFFVCGNGGSAADAQHIAAELSGRYLAEREPLDAAALSCNASALTAIGNDYGFDRIFARQLEAHGRAGDVLLAISTSGNSANVLEAVRSAKKLGIASIALTGSGGGALAEEADAALRVPSNHTPRIQEMHILIGHALCGIVEKALCR